MTDALQWNKHLTAPALGSTQVAMPSPPQQPQAAVPLFSAQQVPPPPPAPQYLPSPSAFDAQFLLYHTERQAALEQRAAKINLEARLDLDALHGSSTSGVADAAASAEQPGASFTSVPLAAVATAAAADPVLSGFERTGALDEQGLLLPRVDTFNSLRLQPGASSR